MGIEFNTPISKAKAAYEMMSRAELTEHKAKLVFEREPYYMKFIRKEEINERKSGTSDVDSRV